MFEVVRTGGKQYRVHPGDKIVVEKLDGNAGDRVTLGDVLLAGDGGSLKSTDGLTVAAEIVAQAKADKVIVFKKRRRHNYRRKSGHRQQHTILRIVAIGDQKAEKPARKAKAAPAGNEAPVAATPAQEAPAAEAPKKAKAKKAAPQPAAPVKAEPTASAQVDAPKAKKASPKKPAADKNA